jgi:hypothetical protein
VLWPGLWHQSRTARELTGVGGVQRMPVEEIFRQGVQSRRWLDLRPARAQPAKPHVSLCLHRRPESPGASSCEHVAETHSD